MGMGYLTPQMKEYYRKREITCLVRENGHIISMPRYYKEKYLQNKNLKSYIKDTLKNKSTTSVKCSRPQKTNTNTIKISSVGMISLNN